MSDTGKVAQSFLNQLAGKDVSLFFETLTTLMEQLETKGDPDPIELKLIENIYHTIEKWKIMEGNLRSYVHDFLMEDSPTSVLSDLYEGESAHGSSKWFSKE